MMGEFKLVPRESLEAYLASLRAPILGLCPKEDHAMLLENLSRLGEQAGALMSPVRTIHRQAPTEGGPAVTATGAQRAAAAGTAGGESAGAGEGRARAPFPSPSSGSRPGRLPARSPRPGWVSAADGGRASFARGARILPRAESYMARLSPGPGAGTATCSAPRQSLPLDYRRRGGAELAPVETRALGAMRRLITGRGPVEISKDFIMFRAGGTFKEGSLPQAVHMVARRAPDQRKK